MNIHKIGMAMPKKIKALMVKIYFSKKIPHKTTNKYLEKPASWVAILLPKSPGNIFKC